MKDSLQIFDETILERSEGVCCVDCSTSASFHRRVWPFKGLHLAPLLKPHCKWVTACYVFTNGLTFTTLGIPLHDEEMHSSTDLLVLLWQMSRGKKITAWCFRNTWRIVTLCADCYIWKCTQRGASLLQERKETRHISLWEFKTCPGFLLLKNTATGDHLDSCIEFKS